MARIITAVEIFPNGIHGLEIAWQRKSVEVLRYIEEPLSGDPLSSDGLSLFFSEHNLHREEVVTSVPGDMLITRNVSVPFHEKAKISKVLPYEVEPLVPFPIHELEVCYRLLQQEKGRSDLLVYALPKRLLDQRSDLFSGAGIPLRMIGISSLSAANTLLEMQTMPKDKTALHLHVLPDFSILSIYTKGMLHHFTNLSWGGRDFVEKLLAVTGLDPDALSEGLSHLTPDEEEEIGRALSGSESEVAAPIRKECDLFLLQSQAGRPDALYLTGIAPGLSLFAPLLGRALSLHAEVPDPLVGLQHSLPKEASRSALHALVGVALMQGGRDSQHCGFRQHKTSPFAKVVESKQEFRYAMIIIAFLVLGVFTDFFVGIQAKEYQYHKIQQEMRQLFQETFPDVKNVVNALEQMKLRMKDLDKQNEILRSVFGEKPSSLEILNELSTRIPSKIELSITDFSIDEKSIRFVGWTDTFESVNRIEQNLKQSTLFESAKVSNAKVGKDKNRVNFQMLLTYKK
jgi:general secretion pathway protein L